MPPAGLGPTIPVSERPQTHALDRAATGIGDYEIWREKLSLFNRDGVTVGLLKLRMYTNNTIISFLPHNKQIMAPLQWQTD
jgi:hypothetical protein